MKSFYRFMFYTPFVVPFPVMAMLLKLCVAYLVCIDTVSLLLECTEAFEIMNDCLVIAFLADLDVVFWYLFSVVFHLDDFDNFVLRTASVESVWHARKTSVFKPIHRCFACFRRSRMGRKAEGFVAFVAVFLLYTRQCIVLLYALDTNVLPMARDVCTLWRWETDRG